MTFWFSFASSSSCTGIVKSRRSVGDSFFQWCSWRVCCRKFGTLQFWSACLYASREASWLVGKEDIGGLWNMLKNPLSGHFPTSFILGILLRYLILFYSSCKEREHPKMPHSRVSLASLVTVCFKQACFLCWRDLLSRFQRLEARQCINCLKRAYHIWGQEQYAWVDRVSRAVAAIEIMLPINSPPGPMVVIPL